MLLSFLLACAVKNTPTPLLAPSAGLEKNSIRDAEASHSEPNDSALKPSSLEPDLSPFPKAELAPEEIAAVLQELMQKFWTADSREVVASVCNQPVNTENVRLERFVNGTCAKLNNDDASLYSAANLEPIQGTWSYDPDRLTLVTFWELWCPHCKRALPHLEKLRSQFAGADFDVIGITNLTRGVNVKLVQTYATEQQLAFPLLKGKEEFSSKYGVRGIPDAMLMKNDKIIWRGHPAAVTAEVIQYALSW